MMKKEKKHAVKNLLRIFCFMEKKTHFYPVQAWDVTLKSFYHDSSPKSPPHQQSSQRWVPERCQAAARATSRNPGAIIKPPLRRLTVCWAWCDTAALSHSPSRFLCDTQPWRGASLRNGRAKRRKGDSERAASNVPTVPQYYEVIHCPLVHLYTPPGSVTYIVVFWGYLRFTARRVAPAACEFRRTLPILIFDYIM